VAAVEIGASYVSPGQGSIKGGAIAEAREDKSQERYEERKKYYEPNRHILLVHRLVPSSKPGQLYDVLLYLIPHHSSAGTLASVRHVEYYFGHHWGNQVFKSEDRARGFAIATSAFGAFMCTARIHFTDDKTVMVSRYVDFEMGPLGQA
jgi:hypothetical protein